MEKIKRGQIWLASFNPARGSEQSGIRPALILQNDIGNKYSVNTIILAITSKNSNFKLDIPIKISNENNLEIKSYVKCSQILTISKERLIKPMGKISDIEMSLVDEAVRTSLSL